jgi:hypothetical protein
MIVVIISVLIKYLLLYTYKCNVVTYRNISNEWTLVVSMKYIVRLPNP